MCVEGGDGRGRGVGESEDAIEVWMLSWCGLFLLGGKRDDAMVGQRAGATHVGAGQARWRMVHL
jgi:hypothetical protein